VRSKDFKNKRSYVKALKNKAAERNPDEFYFKMNTSKVEGGKHTDIVDNSLGNFGIA
jgi:U3 small nucleolar RNA-associated protein 11